MRALLSALVAATLFSAPASAAYYGNLLTSVQSSATEGSRVLKASAGLLNGFSATNGAAAGYVLIIDSATVPSDGAVTPKFCYYMAANQTVAASWNNYPVNFNNGIVIVYSTTGCFTKTASATAFFAAQVQ
jgi:hypothetical protein